MKYNATSGIVTLKKRDLPYRTRAIFRLAAIQSIVYDKMSEADIHVGTGGVIEVKNKTARKIEKLLKDLWR